MEVARCSHCFQLYFMVLEVVGLSSPCPVAFLQMQMQVQVLLELDLELYYYWSNRNWSWRNLGKRLWCINFSLSPKFDNKKRCLNILNPLLFRFSSWFKIFFFALLFLIYVLVFRGIFGIKIILCSLSLCGLIFIDLIILSSI